MANILLTLLLIVSLSISAANAKDYYMAQNGIDDNDGSENKPWRSIQQAARTAQAGDNVFIKNGTYIERVTVNNSGSSGNYIIFKEYPGHTVILDGTGHAGWQGVFSIYGKDYFKLQDLEIRNNRIGWGVLVEQAQGDSGGFSTVVEGLFDPKLYIICGK